MIDWVKVARTMPNNKKTYELADLLAHAANDLFAPPSIATSADWWRARAGMLLVQFWGYAAEQHPDGDVTRAHQDQLRDAIRPWTEGTEWSTKDVRELLLKSGHLVKDKRGRIEIQAWFEYTGAELEKLRKDRERKALHRKNRARGRSQDTEPDNPGARPQTVQRSKAEQSRAKQRGGAAASNEAAERGPVGVDYLLRCVIALNAGIRANYRIAHPREIAASTQVGAVDWEQDAIPVELAERVVEDRAATYMPKATSPQPQSLRYFDSAVREAWTKSGNEAEWSVDKIRAAKDRALQEEQRAALGQ